MKDLFSKESDLMKALDEHLKKVEAIHKLPQYAEFLKYKEELDQFKEFIDLRRLEKTREIIFELLKDDYKHRDSEKKVKEWLDRIKNLEERLSDSAWKRHETFCSSNIMDHIWEFAKKYGEPVDVEGDFEQSAFKIGNYTMAIYSGQGEYGYAIYVNKRIF